MDATVRRAVDSAAGRAAGYSCSTGSGQGSGSDMDPLGAAVAVVLFMLAAPGNTAGKWALLGAAAVINCRTLALVSFRRRNGLFVSRAAIIAAMGKICRPGL